MAPQFSFIWISFVAPGIATTVSPGFLPAALSVFERAFSDTPPPYTSAVSNQLIPPSRERIVI
jgi:hypothetical protein